MKTRIVTTTVVASAILALAGTASGGSPGASPRSVVAAFYPVAFAAHEIGGPTVSVRNLTPAGAEPHDLELQPSDVTAIQHAAVVLYLGGGFQPAVEKAIASTHAHGLDLLRNANPTAAQGGPELDPHVWLDPIRYAQMARRIGHALGRPAAAARFAARLRALDRRYRAGLSSCRRRTIVTSHAAFGYLAARYGLRQLALEGLSPEAEPSPQDLSRLIRAVRRSGATTVFFEPLVSPKLAETVARDAHVEAASLDPLEGVTSDAEHRGANYFTVMQANLASLQRALGCR